MYEYSCRINRVIDGDSVDVCIDLGFDISFTSSVRLYGVDTPESRTRDPEEKKCGLLAKKFLEEAVKNGKNIIIRTQKDEKGKFGRVLGSLIIDGTNINHKMIEENLAVAYYGQSKDSIAKGHLVNRGILVEKGLLNLE
jgi:micrococcal nuclease|tara:strand:- start:1637 stop:2053 length:417 start_codon:yes stop_codon:yes gene_type:complete